MANFLKALLVTGLTIGPVMVKEFAGPNWSWPWFVVYVFAALIGYWKVAFRPDERFGMVRQPSLDLFFDRAFADAHTPEGTRFPFRVNVYRPDPLPIVGPWLAVAYEWNSNPADADHGKCWWLFCGLVGRVYQTGKWAFYKKGDDLSEYGLGAKDEADTAHLVAVLAIPLRRPSADKERVSGRVTAVLAIDALTPAAAAELESWCGDLVQGRSNPLVDKAAWLSLYF